MTYVKMRFWNLLVCSVSLGIYAGAGDLFAADDKEAAVHELKVEERHEAGEGEKTEIEDEEEVLEEATERMEQEVAAHEGREEKLAEALELSSARE